MSAISSVDVKLSNFASVILVYYMQTLEARTTNQLDLVIAHESAFAQPGGKVGGAAHVVRKQAEALLFNSHPVRVISPKPEGQTVEASHVPAVLFDKPDTPDNDELLRILTTDGYFQRFGDLLVRNVADSPVYAHYYVAGGVASKLKKERIMGRPLVYMGHSWDRVVATMDPTRRISSGRDSTERQILNLTDDLIVATNAERRLLAAEYADVVVGGEKAIFKKTHVVPLGVDRNIFNPVNIGKLRTQVRREMLPEDLQESTNFFMLGRISEQKDQLGAIQAFSEVVRDPNLDISLSIFGGPLKGEYYERIMDYLASQPQAVRQRTLFHGIQPTETALATGDVFLGPSRWETWFLSLSEAMAAGLPTIVSDKPILREVGGTGTFYVDEINPDSIASAIHLVSTNPELRYRSSVSNIVQSCSYTWGNSARALRRVLGQYEHVSARFD